MSNPTISGRVLNDQYGTDWASFIGRDLLHAIAAYPRNFETLCGLKMYGGKQRRTPQDVMTHAVCALCLRQLNKPTTTEGVTMNHEQTNEQKTNEDAEAMQVEQADKAERRVDVSIDAGAGGDADAAHAEAPTRADVEAAIVTAEANEDADAKREAKRAAKRAAKAAEQHALRFKTESGTVADFVEQAFSIAEEVGGELREAFDNAPENLKGSDVNTRREAAADTLEGLSPPDVDDLLGQLDCACQIDGGKIYRGRMSQSRACRIANAVSMIDAAQSAVQEWLDAHDELPDADMDDPESLRERADAIDRALEVADDVDAYNSAREAADSLIAELDEARSELDGLDIPGMFG